MAEKETYVAKDRNGLEVKEGDRVLVRGEIKGLAGLVGANGMNCHLHLSGCADAPDAHHDLAWSTTGCEKVCEAPSPMEGFIDNFVMSFVFGQIAKLKPKPENAQAIKDAGRAYIRAWLRSNEATFDDGFEDKICDVHDAGIDLLIVGVEPVPMGDAADVEAEVRAMGFSPILTSILLTALVQYGPAFVKKLLERWKK